MPRPNTVVSAPVDTEALPLAVAIALDIVARTVPDIVELTVGRHTVAVTTATVTTVVGRSQRASVSQQVLPITAAATVRAMATVQAMATQLPQHTAIMPMAAMA